MFKRNINKILSTTFIFSSLGISSCATEINADNTLPEIASYREALRVTVTASDESGIREFRDPQGNTIVGDTITMEFNRRVDSTFTAIDNAGNENRITIDLSWVNPYTTNKAEVHPARAIKGASYWSSSNIREWLNSSSNKVEYTNNSPTDENTYNNGYNEEPGFLNEFSNDELGAIAVTERIVWTHEYLDPKSKVFGNGNPGHFNETLPITLSNNLKQVLNYKEFSHYEEQDKVYLASPFEVYWYMERRGLEIKKSVTKEVQDKYNVQDGYNDWYLIGTTTGGPDSEAQYHVNRNGRFKITDTKSPFGIAPIINIKPDYIMSNGLNASDLKIGDNIEFGRYLGASITWTVINISDNGSPMMISDRILDLKVFDAKGDEARLYSDYINYSNVDIDLTDNLQYKSTKMQEDTEIPTGLILNEDVLNNRYNESFFIDLKFQDLDSGIDYIKKPDGTITHESEFRYEISENGNYIFEIMDNAGNFNKFGIPISNINDEAYLKIEPSSNDWTNDGAIYIESSNTVKATVNGSTTGNIVKPPLPNYVSYKNVTFKVRGTVEVVSIDKSIITQDEGVVNIGFNYDTIGPNNSFTYTAGRSYNYGLSKVKVKYEEGYRVYFENDITIPSNYLRDLSPSMNTGMDRGLRIKFENIEYYLEDDSDFSITSIILPDGSEIKDVKNYIDNIKEDGIHNLTYKVLDNRGLTTEKTVTVKIDKSKPILNLNYNYNKYDFLENKSLRVNISGSDSLSGFKRIKLPDGTYISSPSTTYTINNYGTHIFECEDVAGNITRKVIEVEDMSDFEDSEKLVEKAEQTKAPIDIETARGAVNKLPESSKKDELQARLNAVSPNVYFDEKVVTSNLDVYIKSNNMLSLSLNRNSISFKDFNGTEDLEQGGALELSVNSSLPYEINACLEDEIQNADKSQTMDKSILSLKESSDSDYKEFLDIKTKLNIVSHADTGNDKIHIFDFKLNGGIAHKKDVYKAVIKFEVNQK